MTLDDVSASIQTVRNVVACHNLEAPFSDEVAMLLGVLLQERQMLHKRRQRMLAHNKRDRTEPVKH